MSYGGGAAGAVIEGLARAQPLDMYHQATGIVDRAQQHMATYRPVAKRLANMHIHKLGRSASDFMRKASKVGHKTLQGGQTGMGRVLSSVHRKHFGHVHDVFKKYTKGVSSGINAHRAVFG